MSVLAMAPVFLEAYFAKEGETVAGAALALQNGVATKIRVHQEHGKAQIFYNVQSSPSHALMGVLRKFRAELDDVPIRIEQTGMQILQAKKAVELARARSLALALNEWCEKPYSLQECSRIAWRACGRPQNARLHANMGEGGLHYWNREGKERVVRLARDEIRTPISLQFFATGPSEKKDGKERWMWADGADEIMKKGPDLQKFAKASRYFALRTRGKWAKSRLEGNERTGIWAGVGCAFEPMGMKTQDKEGAWTGLDGASFPLPSGGRLRKPVFSMTAYASNLGARILPSLD